MSKMQVMYPLDAKRAARVSRPFTALIAGSLWHGQYERAAGNARNRARLDDTIREIRVSAIRPVVGLRVVEELAEHFARITGCCGPLTIRSVQSGYVVGQIEARIRRNLIEYKRVRAKVRAWV